MSYYCLFCRSGGNRQAKNDRQLKTENRQGMTDYRQRQKIADNRGQKENNRHKKTEKRQWKTDNGQKTTNINKQQQ